MLLAIGAIAVLGVGELLVNAISTPINAVRDRREHREQTRMLRRMSDKERKQYLEQEAAWQREFDAWFAKRHPDKG